MTHSEAPGIGKIRVSGRTWKPFVGERPTAPGTPLRGPRGRDGGTAAGVPTYALCADWCKVADPSTQMLFFRVSGIRNTASRNMTAGSAMGETKAQSSGLLEPDCTADANAAVVMMGTRPPPQPLRM